MAKDTTELQGATQSAFADIADLYNKETKAIPKPDVQIGVDTTQSFYQNIIEQGASGNIDMSVFESFFRVAQGRDELYSLMDVMGEDSTIAAILETYAEDATEYNEEGHIMWAESSDNDVAKYVNFLLDSMNVDKHAYKWIYALAKYGDLYLRLYRKSDCKDDDLFGDDEDDIDEDNARGGRKELKEDVKVKAYSKNDHYIHYLGTVPNPAEMFELTKLDKSYAYIEAEINSLAQQRKTGTVTNELFYKYNFRQKDINVYGPTTFVHACLEDNSSRVPEKVSIFRDDMADTDENNAYTYTVRRGQSLLYPTFKIWRELSLLENVILLNRVTKSAVVRVINVEVGDMPKEMVAPHLQRIKSLFEQKSNIKAGTTFGEYTNPGPVENSVYVPTRGGIGTLTTQEVGGSADVGKLSDLDYFQDKFFGAMRVPKQYFGIVDDAAGFSGGQSLSLISSRYAKMVKRLQNSLIQPITDAVNLMLIDAGLNSYINKFTIKMTPPVTQEELDRREAASNKVRLASDVMTLFTGDIEDPVLRLKALKEVLTGVYPGSDLSSLIQDAIDAAETEAEPDNPTDTAEDDSLQDVNIDAGDINIESEGDLDSMIGLDNTEMASTEQETPEKEESESLPTMAELGDMDFTDNNNPVFTA